MPRIKRRAASGSAATSLGAADPTDEREERGGGELEVSSELWPMSGEPALQAMHELEVALLVQIHEVDGGSQVALVVCGREPRRGDAIDVRAWR